MAAAKEETSSLFPIFLLSVLALFVVPWTLYRILSTSSKKKPQTCSCSLCSKAPKNQVTLGAKVVKFLSVTNVVLILLWTVMLLLVYYVKLMSKDVTPFEPYEILGLQRGATESEIRKAYYRLSRQYHPDKNPDPEAATYFVEFISKAYKALTDPVARENLEKYGHPDGHQGTSVGVALPLFLLSMGGASSGVVLAGIVGVGILLPLLVAVIYLTRSSKYTGNYVMHQTQYYYYHLLKPSLAPSKVLEVLVRAQEFLELPVRRSDEDPLQRLFTLVRSELNLDVKNLKQEQAKFWKKNHPALIKAELLLLAQMTTQAADVPDALRLDFKHVLELLPRLLEELMKLSLVQRPPDGYGWLRPAQGVMELSQCVFQAVPLSSRKASAAAGAGAEGIAPLLQLPHMDDSVIKKIGRKKVRTLPELVALEMSEREELLTITGGLTSKEVEDVEAVLSILPEMHLDVEVTTEGEEGIQEGDVVTLRAWLHLERPNGMLAVQPHLPHYPYAKDEGWWLLLADTTNGGNSVLVSQKVTFTDETVAVSTASKLVREQMEGSGAEAPAVAAAVRSAVERVRKGARLVSSKFLAPPEGTYNLTAFCLSDTWIGCDRKVNVKLKVAKRSRAGTRGFVGDPNAPLFADGSEEGSDAASEADDEDIESEYSEEESENEEEDAVAPEAVPLLEASPDSIQANGDSTIDKKGPKKASHK